MRRLALVIALICLASCATTAGYEKMLNAWIGVEELDLVRGWGPPTRFYETSGRKFLAYSTQRTSVHAGMPPIVRTTMVNNVPYTSYIPGTPPIVARHLCQTVFELEGNKVVSWTHQGDDCRAVE